MIKKLLLLKLLSLAFIMNSHCMEQSLTELQSQLRYYQEEARKGNTSAQEEVQYLLGEIRRLYPQAQRGGAQPQRGIQQLPPVSAEWIDYLKATESSNDPNALKEGLQVFDNAVRDQAGKLKATVQKEALDLINRIKAKLARLQQPQRRVQPGPQPTPGRPARPVSTGPRPTVKPRPVSTGPGQVRPGQVNQAEIDRLHDAALDAVEKVVTAARAAGQNEIANIWMKLAQ